MFSKLTAAAVLFSGSADFKNINWFIIRRAAVILKDDIACPYLWGETVTLSTSSSDHGGKCFRTSNGGSDTAERSCCQISA